MSEGQSQRRKFANSEGPSHGVTMVHVPGNTRAIGTQTGVVGGKGMMTGITDVRTTKTNVGRRGKRRNPYKSLLQKRTMITHWSGLSNFDGNNGAYGMQMTRNVTTFSYSGTDTQVQTLFLPMYAYNLSSPPVGFHRETLVWKMPFYQLTKTCFTSALGVAGDPFYCWQPVTGQYNTSAASSVAAFPNAAIEGWSRQGHEFNSSYRYAAVVESDIGNYQASASKVAYHDWSDIGIAIYGAKNRVGSISAQIVKFNSEAACPSRIYTSNLDATAVEYMAGPNPGLFPAYPFVSAEVEIPLQYPALNPSGGLNTEIDLSTIAAGTLSASASADADACSAWWDSYWSRKTGHPLVSSKNFTSGSAPYRVIKTVNIGVPTGRSDDEDPLVPRSIHNIFYKDGSMSNLVDADGQALIRNTLDPVVTAVTGGAASIRDGFNTIGFLPATNTFADPDRLKDSWLIITTKDYMFSESCASGAGHPYLDSLVPNGIFSPGDAGQQNIDGKVYDVWGKTPSFDLVVRSKFTKDI
jgi:hypothetical protein